MYNNNIEIIIHSVREPLAPDGTDFSIRIWNDEQEIFFKNFSYFRSLYWTIENIFNDKLKESASLSTGRYNIKCEIFNEHYLIITFSTEGYLKYDDISRSGVWENLSKFEFLIKKETYINSIGKIIENDERFFDDYLECWKKLMAKIDD